MSDAVHERLRYVSSMSGLTQGEIVERALAEYVERHAGELYEGLRRAHAALDGGTNAAVAYVLGVSKDEIDRIAGPDDEDQMIRPKRKRPAGVRP